MGKRILTYTSYLYLMSYALTVTSMGPCNAHIAAAFHVGERAMGLLISTHFAGFIVTTVFAGWLIDRAGLKPVMLGGSALLGVSLMAFGRAPNAGLLFFAMFLSGVGGGAIEAAVNALISAMYSESRVYNLNLLHIFFGVGAFTWPTLAGYLLDTGVTWRTLYMLIGAFSLAMTAAMAPQKFPEPAQGGPQGPRQTLAMLRHPAVWLLGGVVALYVGGEIGINGWIVRYFDEDLLHGAPFAHTLRLALGGRVFAFTITTSVFLTLYWFSMTVGRVFATVAGRTVPDYVLLRTVTLLSAVFGIATFLVSDIRLAALFLALTGLCFSGIFPTTLALGANRFPERLGMISGLIIAFSGVGNVALNAAIGEIAQRTHSIRNGMLFAAILLTGMAACAFALGTGQAGGGGEEKR